MAALGLCKACRIRVSDEAVSCPQCGQPGPCLAGSTVGTLLDGKVCTETDVLLPSLNTTASIHLFGEIPDDDERTRFMNEHLDRPIRVRITYISERGGIQVGLANPYRRRGL